MQATFDRPALLATLGACIATPVMAEGPMATGDAGTLDQGGMEVEAVLSRDD